MEAIKLCRLDTPIIFIEARINLSRFVVTGCAAKTSATVTFPSLNLISLFAFCFNIWLNGVASQPSLVSWIKHSVDRFVIVSIFIPKLRLILILNSFLGSSDSLVFSELFHSLAPRPLAARDRKSGSAGMPRPISYAVFCLKKKKENDQNPVFGITLVWEH